MSNLVSNLYAARIFAEHPISLWSLDDEFHFISQVTQSQKSIDNWTKSNLTFITSSSASTPYGVILEDEITSIVRLSASTILTASATASAINTVDDLDTDKNTISINLFAYDFTGYVSSFDIGFMHSGSSFYSNVHPEDTQVWTKVSHTMTVPSGNIDMYPFFRINYRPEAPTNINDYNVAVNAISVGQWSELYHYKSTGIIPQSISDPTLLSLLTASAVTSLLPSDIKLVSADSYGLANSKLGYYVIEKNKMLATSLDFPITFGSNNVTSLNYPIFSNIPSLIFEGDGFLNEYGRYSKLTLEFWLRAYTNAKIPVRIFGPINSDDGIYIDNDFITIKIGLNKKSYFIGKWYRPMLIDFAYEIDTASLLINGDLVISMQIDQDQLTLPTKDYDYVCFYGDEEVTQIEVDTIAIYPYAVPEQIAKRRFVYAQGVESANNITTNFNGDSFQLDFPFANYTSTINYPDMNDWNSGYFNNLNSTSNYLSSPEYLLPEIIFTKSGSGAFTGINENQFLNDNYSIQTSDYPFLKLKPNANYNNIESSIYFQTLSVLNSPVRSMFGIFTAPSTLSASKETIAYFSNSFTNNTFSIKISNSGLEYFYNDTQISESIPVSASSMFIAGIDIKILSEEYSDTISNFFSNLQNVSLRLGGTQTNTYSGKIHRFTFNNPLFTEKDLKEHVLEDGIFESSIDSFKLMYYIGNYTYYPQILNGGIILDIGSCGYWEDSIPLSYFGKFVQNKDNESYYDLDMIQFNIESPSSLILKKDEYYLDGGSSRTSNNVFWFDNEFSTTSSSAFDISVDGGSASIEEETVLNDSQLDVAFEKYSKDNYYIKSYISLQHSDDVGTIPYSNYTNTERINGDRVLDFDGVITDFNTTKYEVVDRAVIFPPKEQVDFNDYYVTIHLEFQTSGIINNPIKLRRMSLSSLAYDETDFYSINSPDGYRLYPFTRYDTTYSYKDKNPFSVYKDTTSYMYTTGDSGISVLPYESTAKRGVTVPINQQISNLYLFGALQFWGFYNKDSLITQDTQIGKMTTPLESYDIYLIPEEGGKRAKMVFYYSEQEGQTAGVESTNIVFYQNGEKVQNPYITPLSWNSILVSFIDSIDLQSEVGQFEIYEGYMVNNIGFYRKSSDILGTETVPNVWQDLRLNSSWGDWDEGVWTGIETETQILTFNIDGKTIYDSTFGVSNIVSRDNTVLNLNSDKVLIVTEAEWKDYLQIPV